mmetsp:Transcript_2475/g.3625  ORF Transcript_2475/g.3625 Transcript_2475/m.3625 type:complete len:257 (-) Transcript_2475:84-854(-)
MNRSMQNFAKKRPACVLIASFILVLQLLRHVFQWKIKKYGLRAVKVFRKHEFYRLFTSAVFHNSWRHLTMNLGTIFVVGPALEDNVGSKNFVLMTLGSILLISLLYIPSAYGLSYILHDVNWRRKGVKGFSGVLFHWTYLFCQKDGMKRVSFLNNIKIRTKNYPLVSLLIMYLIDPKNKRGTLVHVIGIVVGFLHTKGYFTSLFPAAPSWKIAERAKDINSLENENENEKEISDRKLVEPNQLDSDSLREKRLKRF